jgi:hypothetical protein
MSPIILGLVLAASIAHLTAAPARGWLAALLATAEERCPTRLIVARWARSRAWQGEEDARDPRRAAAAAVKAG